MLNSTRIASFLVSCIKNISNGNRLSREHVDRKGFPTLINFSAERDQTADADNVTNNTAKKQQQVVYATVHDARG